MTVYGSNLGPVAGILADGPPRRKTRSALPLFSRSARPAIFSGLQLFARECHGRSFAAGAPLPERYEGVRKVTGLTWGSIVGVATVAGRKRAC